MRNMYGVRKCLRISEKWLKQHLGERKQHLRLVSLTIGKSITLPLPVNKTFSCLLHFYCFQSPFMHMICLTFTTLGDGWNR